MFVFSQSLIDLRQHWVVRLDSGGVILKMSFELNVSLSLILLTNHKFIYFDFFWEKIEKKCFYFSILSFATIFNDVHICSALMWSCFLFDRRILIAITWRKKWFDLFALTSCLARVNGFFVEKSSLRCIAATSNDFLVKTCHIWCG